MIKKILPLKPISANAVWQGRRFKTKAYKQFREDFGKCATGAKQILGPVRVDLTFILKKANFARSDVDNLIKPVLDGIVEKGYIEDDRKIVELTAKKVLGSEYAIKFTIEEV